MFTKKSYEKNSSVLLETNSLKPTVVASQFQGRGPYSNWQMQQWPGLLSGHPLQCANGRDGKESQGVSANGWSFIHFIATGKRGIVFF